MKKPTLKRLLLGLVQHFAVAAAVVTMMFIALHIRVTAPDLYGGDNTYTLAPFSGARRFEDTDTFDNMLSTAVRDLATLVVIKEQLETSGAYDGDKVIDATAFVNRKGIVSSCPVTAAYRLDDLIKWGKAGISLTDKVFSKEEFVTFFGTDILKPINFTLDENGRLSFTGLAGTDFMQTEENKVAYYDEEVYVMMYDVYALYSREQLINLVFEYLLKNMDKEIAVAKSGDGETVIVPMLSNKYNTVKNQALTDIPDNWLDYCDLESNVINTIESLQYNYNLYQNRGDLYKEGNSNLYFLFRLKEDDGYHYYSNLPDNFDTADEQGVDEYFSSMGKYLIYSLDKMSYESNTGLKDSELYGFLNAHDYAYPQDTKMWVGVDTTFYVEDDIFALAGEQFRGLVPQIWKFLLFIGSCLSLWLAIWNYLSFTAGRALDENGVTVHYLNWFDRFRTELVLAFGFLLAYLGYLGVEFLLLLGSSHLVYGYRTAYAYGISAVYGFLASLSFCAMWYSLMRRIKGKNLWKDSILHTLWSRLCKVTAMLLYHKSTAVRTLLPFNGFLLINLGGLAGAYMTRYSSSLLTLGILGCLLLFDALVGMVLFRRNAEMQEIVEGINRIRSGEVDYELDTEKLHGENREIAEAVNNIGEGIRNAVETSMKDERMKADLITNVSHDIKTPLTSIINYVDLLKRLGLQEEPARSYILVLDEKTQRLKQLTDDLVEASKISSGNIVLSRERLNLTELLNQTIGEFSEKLEEKGLLIVFNDPDTPAFIYADSRRMWRVIENLFNNICKYAMPNTRVYLDMVRIDARVEISIKNISERQLNISPEELTERFIRGDESRTTEGSGLGLSIAKNLAELQGGIFRLYLDGDLFKVMLEFPEYAEKERVKAPEASPESGDGGTDSPAKPGYLSEVKELPLKCGDPQERENPGSGKKFEAKAAVSSLVAHIAGEAGDMQGSKSERPAKRRLTFRQAAERLALRRGQSGGEIKEIETGEVRIGEAELREGRIREAELREGRIGEAELREGRIREAELREGRIREAELGERSIREAEPGEGRIRGAEPGKKE